MCRVYNTVGSLTTIKTHLNQNGIDNFNSVNDLLSFQKSYSFSRQQILSNQNILLTDERNNLSAGILSLENEITNDKNVLQHKLKSKVEYLERQYDEIAEAEKTIIQEFTYSFRAIFNMIQIIYFRLFSNLLVYLSVRPKIEVLNEKRKRFQYLSSSFEEAVKESCALALQHLDHTKRAIDEINNFIYGAIGENKVVTELRKLSDDYILINDFSFTFNRPLYYKQQETRINTIQIDHILVSQAGVFQIETKNWSKKSLESLNMRSPVQQIQRANFSLYFLLNRTNNFRLVPHHWGKRKIPIKNLIVLINNKPMEEFEYVKILTLDELVPYIEYFKPSMSKVETEEIADYLIKIRD